MGMYCEVLVASREDAGQLAEPEMIIGRIGGVATAERVSLEKAWHGLHYLLTGEVWEGSGPQAFLLGGGEQIGADDESPIRWFTPEETREIHQVLASVSDNQLWSRFDAEEMERQQIYPGIWDESESDLKDEYLEYFHQLKQVVAAAAKSGQGLMVSIG